jgi:SAM-dependent MidA family methyltransferase
LCLPQLVRCWNSFATQPQLYTFQDFYTDAQYGPDFGYYSTGQILHSDGPADNGSPDTDDSGGQKWFNSYTTLPMSLSPDFAHALCDRVYTMWKAMGEPSPFVLIEFGGGTGMLARDILRRSRDAHADFYEALARYVIAERSRAMRSAQRHTAAEFVAAGKLGVVEVDAREAAAVRPYLNDVMDGHPVVGIILSNELLDEMDPVRLRLMWHAGQLPSVRRCTECRSFREAYVLHRVGIPVLEALLRPDASNVAANTEEHTKASVQSVIWEGSSLACGMLDTPALAQAILTVANDLPAAERGLCSPMLVCCLPFLLAVNQALQYNHAALHSSYLQQREEDGSTELGRLYRHHVKRTNGTVLLSKERYRELRRRAVSLGPEVERAFLVGGHRSVLPGRVHSEEVFLALSPGRCKELQGWMGRNAERLAAAAHLRNNVAWIYDGDDSTARTAMHLKMVVRPGEAQFVEQTSRLLDNGFLVTVDYGSDADALMWQALIRPNYEGITVMDARFEFLEECTEVSYLECPGLQDLTTSVDFTEVAQAGKSLGGWSVLAYGPLFLLELSFAQALPELAPPGDPLRLGHLLERAGGLRTTGLQAWYLKPEQEPWASFKILVQQRGEHGGHWTLGPLGMEWPLQSAPRFFRSPSSCWRQDLTKPPLAALIASHAHRTLGNEAQDAYAELLTHNGSSPTEASSTLNGRHREESATEREVLLQHFQSLLLRSTQPLTELIESQQSAQKQAYADAHLAMLLVDYLRFLRPNEDCTVHHGDDVEKDLRQIGTSRRLHELYTPDHFDRVLADISKAVLQNSTLYGLGAHAPFVCLAERALRSHCESVESPAGIEDTDGSHGADPDVGDLEGDLGGHDADGGSDTDIVADSVATSSENGSHSLASDASLWGGKVHATYDGAAVLDKAQWLSAIAGEAAFRVEGSPAASGL